jgi:lysylphosphatidylglycerol synthetase-like protein (DUF2156 family)
MRSIAEIRAVHGDLPPDRDTEQRVHLVGELAAIRKQGAISFGTLRTAGSPPDLADEIQLFVESRTAGQLVHSAFGALSRGDRVEVYGTVMTTRRGALSIRVADIVRLSPAVEAEALPDRPIEEAGSAFVHAATPPLTGAIPVPTVVEHRQATVPRPVETAAPPLRPGGWPVRLIAGLTAVDGLLELVDIWPALHRLDRFEMVLDPDWFVVVNKALSVFIGVGLLLLADQLAKRKRAAWRIAVALFTISAAGHMWKGPPPAVTVSVAMVVALLVAHDRFHATPDPPSLWRLVRFLPIYLGAVSLFGVGALYVERARLRPELTLWGALDTVFSGLVGLDGDYLYMRPRFGAVFGEVLVALGWFGLVVFAVLLFRPLRARGPHTESDWRHALDLVRAYGWDTLAYFALREDKSFFFGSDGEAMLAYTYSGGYALVAGDPIGPRESVSRLLDEFLAMCDGRAWNPAFLAIRQSDFPLYSKQGFRSFYLGDEAILHCDRFDLAALPKSVRAAVRRVGRRYRFALIVEADVSAELTRELNAISARWRGKAPERGFTMSLSQDVQGQGANPEFLVCVAFDENDRPGGFLRLVPAYGVDPGYTLDMMRHDPGAPNGMTEFLIVSTAQALAGHGVRRLSMNFAMWGRLFADDVPFTALEKLARRMVIAVNPFFQIRSLQQFNAKFDPEWLPRILAFRRPADLPKVGLLYAAAEGFLALPLIGDMLVPKAVGGASRPTQGAHSDRLAFTFSETESSPRLEVAGDPP